ncbi:hypothetical protein H5079_18120 [Pseudoalteromonas sp. SG44-5]|uniref:hypothetical protein n=1 Tax=Pseudoalteromonas sp. SG44-5 TaxID=2760960 RepID=UPI0015FAF7DD|nr:hypothetical protein [Pseudoalteromonas sp. SG44-5]MBB1407517.1 hypothetical protein [Pseudoalteromonas sp. SG44-5]
MSQCVAIQPDQTLKAVTGVCDFVVVTQAEFLELQQHGLVNVLNELFAFDLATFGLINSAALVAFITAHCIGRVVRVMGKT